MRKGRRTLCGIFVVLIVFCVTFPVVSQQTKPGSPVLQYTGQVHLPKLVQDVNDLLKSVETLTKNQDTLIKDVGELKEEVARIDERTGITQTIVITGICGLFVTIIGAVIVQILFFKRQNILYNQQPAPRPVESDEKERKDERKYEYQTGEAAA